MGQFHALGTAGCAGGVEDNGGIIRRKGEAFQVAQVFVPVRVSARKHIFIGKNFVGVGCKLRPYIACGDDVAQ